MMACLVDVVGQGFFAVDVLAELQCRKRGERMGMFVVVTTTASKSPGVVEESAKV